MKERANGKAEKKGVGKYKRYATSFFDRVRRLFKKRHGKGFSHIERVFRKIEKR